MYEITTLNKIKLDLIRGGGSGGGPTMDIPPPNQSFLIFYNIVYKIIF